MGLRRSSLRRVPLAAMSGLLLALLALFACRPIEVELAAPEPTAGSGSLLVGAARRDITPIPGYPMGGHSFEGQYSAGTLGKSYARAIYLEDPRGQPVVLLAADVWAVSIGLRDRVVEVLQREHGLTHIGREHVVLAATHTHHSPAANASNHAHNLAAGKIWAFDPALFDFLARRLAAAVVDAHASREPAKLSLARPRVGDFARNRSLEPFDENPEAQAIVDENADLPPCTLSALTSDPRSCKAIDPRVTVLMAEAVGEHRLIAAGLFMAVHATAMPHSTVFYQGDVFGLTAVELEHRLRAEAGGPVVAVFNGPEGDVSPTWAEQSYGDMLRVADNVVSGVWPVFERWQATALGSPVPDTTPVPGQRFRLHHGLFRLSGQRFADEHGHARVTGERAMLATSMLAGAEDGPTALRKTNPEGRRRRKPRAPDHGPGHGHGWKQRSLLQGTDKLLPPEVPLTVVDLDGALVGTLPGEFTSVLGRRIRQSMAARAGVDASAVLLAGLANEYRSYFTTPEEYALQHYEGGSTLYGTYSGTLVRMRLACLAAFDGSASGCGELDEPLARTYRPGPATRTGFWKRPRSRRWLKKIGRAVAESVGEGARGPSLRFEDQAPAWPSARPMAPSARVEVAEGCTWQTLEVDGVPQSSDGYRMLAMVTRLGEAHWSWKVTWLTPKLPPDRLVRIKASGVDGVARCSQLFGPDGSVATGEGSGFVDVGCVPPPGCH